MQAEQPLTASGPRPIEVLAIPVVILSSSSRGQDKRGAVEAVSLLMTGSAARHA